MKLLGNEVPTQEEFDAVVNNMDTFKKDTVSVLESQGAAVVHISSILENHKKSLLVFAGVTAFNLVLSTAAIVMQLL
jgi:hypothetical protein